MNDSFLAHSCVGVCGYARAVGTGKRGEASTFLLARPYLLAAHFCVCRQDSPWTVPCLEVGIGGWFWGSALERSVLPFTHPCPLAYYASHLAAPHPALVQSGGSPARMRRLCAPAHVIWVAGRPDPRRQEPRQKVLGQVLALCALPRALGNGDPEIRHAGKFLSVDEAPSVSASVPS